MPPTTDLSRVRSILDRDRAWSAYAIGDLAPEFAPHCSWHVSDDDSALLLLYRGFHPPILFAIGDERQLATLASEVDAQIASLHVRPESLAAMSATLRPSYTRAVRRMAVETTAFRPLPDVEVVAVRESDADAVSRLYDDGWRHDEGPTFFQPAMLRQGTFRGIWEGDQLIAIAGTHQFSAELGACAIGNVYTRRDRRKRGLGTRVTSAVVQHAIAQGITTMVLNVSQANEAARRVYEQLGFRCHCEFLEGEAEVTIDGLGP